MIIENGGRKLLRKTESIYCNRDEFKNIIIPESIETFKKLKSGDPTLLEASFDTIKRMMNPLFMCMIHRPSLFL